MDHVGRYKIVRELGRGAMGVVYQAIDPTIGRTVAIKTIRLGDVTDPGERTKLRERLFREARSAGILSHPNIVTIYDMQEEGDLTYIAMEYVDGPTLDALMSAKEPIARDDVGRILKEAASGLDYAHQKGIVHRDIKPANIMLSKSGQVKITDFGIAKVTTSEQFTMTGTIVGTPNYMSPEQVKGLPTVDGRADQFSLTVIAFEMLTGEKPFTGEHLTTVVYKIVSGEPIAPQRLNPTLGPQIEGVLKKGLEKEPDGRYLSCLELVTALDRACAATQGWVNLNRGAGQDMPTAAVPGPARPPMPPPVVRRLEDSTTSTKRRRNVSPFTVVLSILVAAGFVGLIAWQAAPWITDSGKVETQPADVTKAATQPPAAKAEPPSDKPSPLQAPVPAPENPPPEAKPSETKPPEAKPPENQPSETKAPDAEVPKPEPEAPKAAPEIRKPSPAVPKIPARRPLSVVPQAVGIVTNPPAALAELDGKSAISCRTPCTLQAPPGRHTIQVTLNGYQTEYRAIDVTEGPQDLAPIVLHVESGTLMLTSEPPGAEISVNGRALGRTTPAQLTLPPGVYNITVSKDGRAKSDQAVIRNSMIRTMKIKLEGQ